jgi:hypothetical protein
MKRDHFPGYPHLKRVCNSAQYGRMELTSVAPTSDGFLLGHATIGTGKNAYSHSVFLGRDPNYVAPDLRSQICAKAPA